MTIKFNAITLPCHGNFLLLQYNGNLCDVARSIPRSQHGREHIDMHVCREIAVHTKSHPALGEPSSFTAGTITNNNNNRNNIFPLSDFKFSRNGH